MDLSSIYHNPRIPEGYYHVKLVDLEVEETGLDRPRLWAKLRIGPMHEECSGTFLYSIIHPTEAAIYYYKNLINTFMVSGNRFHEAIGRWGCIEVYNAQHDKTKYSAVKYVHQPRWIRMRTSEIEQADRDGLLRWDDEAAAA